MNFAFEIMGLFEDYMTVYDEYHERYGSKVAVLYQVGKFHEIYGVDNEHEKLGNAEELSEVLGFKLGRANNQILENSRKNPQMTGFNSVSLDESVDKLVSYGYTVVVVDQVPGTDPVQRKVSYVQSPSTTTTVSVSNQDPFLVAIYYTRAYNKSTQTHYSYIGMSAMDVTTGESYYYESNSSPSDPTMADDDLLRFLQTFNPVEIVLNYGRHVDREKTLKAQLQLWGYRHKNDTEVTGLKPTVFTET